MKAMIDQDSCIGCGLCPDTCPDVFKLDGEKAVVCADPVPPEAQESCQKAAEDCPVDAIKIE